MTGITYVLVHPGFRAVKVGYTSPRTKRLEELGRRGWIVYRRLEVGAPEAARQIEQATLFELRHRLYIPPYLTRTDMRAFGWTETSSLGLIEAREVWDIVCHQAGLLYLSPHVAGPADGRRRNGGTPPRRVRGDSLPNSRMARTQARIEQAANRIPKDSQ